MKSIIVALFASSSLLVSAPLPAFATEVAAACEGTVPEAWQRPGGFCDQNDFNKSLSNPSDSVSCPPVNLAMLGDAKDVMLVAEPITTCCTVPIDYKFVPNLGRVIVASVPCCNYGSLMAPELDNNDMDQRDRVVLVAC
jgi:hypothetical protein